MTFLDGETVIRLGEPADALYLVLEGPSASSAPGALRRSSRGELVGEIQVLAGGPRTANVHAEGSVRMLRVPREAVIAALEADARAAMGLIEVLASRFRELA